MSKPKEAVGYRPEVGESVLVGPKKVPGIARYVGQTRFAKGEWIGVELAEPFGKNDGSVAGHRYFECRMGHGLFLRKHLLAEAPASPTSTSFSTTSSPSRKHSFQEAMQRMESELLDIEE